MQSLEFQLADEAATRELAASLAARLEPPCLIYLQGDLGAGKTFFVRSLLQASGYEGKVKSPTYTLMEPYEIGDVHYFHFDLYRLVEAEELELMGARDVLTQDAISLIEWPEKGAGWLPEPDIRITLSHQYNSGPDSRYVVIEAISKQAAAMLSNF